MRFLPNTLFFCFQGQVTLLILTFVGNPTGIADITAIGRLAAMLAVFSVVFANVLAPRFARCQDANRLPSMYGILIFGTVAALAPVFLLSWLFPAPLLWLLGSKYVGLQSECVWVVGAACLGQLSGVMWVLNSSKAWIRIQTMGYIPLILAVQAIAAMSLDLHQFHGVLIFNLVSAAAPIPLSALDTYFGFKTMGGTR
jgi:hypothetical protein